MKSLTIYLTVQEVEQRLQKLGIPCSFTRDERVSLTTTPIVERAERVFAFPAPVDNRSLNLAAIKSCLEAGPLRGRAIFDHPWYESEDFMRRCCTPGWHVLLMDALPESIQQPVNYLDSAKTSGLHLPTAVEVILMLILHFVESGEQLLAKKHTWCSDTASLNRHVTVGAFGRNGAFISGHPAGYASRGLGICPSVDPADPA